MNVVISQPMYMPWFGLFEQIRLADIYVHYDDVQVTKNSLLGHVQVKLRTGPHWLTVPVRRSASHQTAIKDSFLASGIWRRKHLATLAQAYSRARFFDDMYSLAKDILLEDLETLAELNRRSIEKISEYLGLRPKFIMSSALDCPGKKSERVLNICLRLGAQKYITGHGASKYLDHKLLAGHGIDVYYLRYACVPYAQFYGEFTPYVSILDMIAHCGKFTLEHFNSKFVHWSEFIRNNDLRAAESTK